MDQTSETEKVYQKQKYNEIIDILLEAGYYRAQIATLSEFDKVVGGLCWCIVNSGEDVDVDILFQENSTIGQRIALSEAIVKALRLMKCPSPLQPHQIQGGVGGSDFPAINPVIVWLIKKFLSRRGEREMQLRKISTLQFTRNYKLETLENQNISISQSLAAILSKNKAIRKFKRPQNKGDSEEKRVHSCLLEYGDTFAMATGAGAAGSSSSPSKRDGAGNGEAFEINDDGSKKIIRIGDMADANMAALLKQGGSDLSAFERKLAQAQREAMREEELFAEQSSKEEAELMLQMKQVQDAAGVSGSQVGAIVGIGSSEIGSAAAAYEQELEEARKLMESNMASGKIGMAAAYKRQKENLLKHKEEVMAKAAEVQVLADSMSAKLRLIEEERKSADEYNKQLRDQIAKLALLEGQANQQEELKMLKHLVGLNENMKGQEAAFKTSCKTQMQDLQARMQALDAQASSVDSSVSSEEDKKLNDIEDMYGKVTGKYNRLRQMLAETNLEVASTTRTIDDIPTRTELIQYERRFGELYQEVAWKLEETRKYYAMYNTLDTMLSFIQKEIKLLNSISENFEIAMSRY